MPFLDKFTCMFFNQLQKTIKPEKEGEEKVKKPRFPSILGPQRRPSRIESAPGECRRLTRLEKPRLRQCPTDLAGPLLSPSAGKASDGRPRPQKQLSQPSLGASEHVEAARLRGSQSSEGSELTHSASLNTSSPSSVAYNSDSSRDADSGRELQLNFSLRKSTLFLSLLHVYKLIIHIALT